MTTPCADCGFDATVWQPNDEKGFLAATDLWWQLATEGATDEDLKAALWQAQAHGEVHEVIHRQMAIADAVRAAGAGTPPHEGRVVQVNASGGGVPKQPTDGGTIAYDGLEGDRQADRKHHGRPFQALCLWSTEVIDDLAAAGHPIGPGCAGENITTSGIDWATLRPGSRLRIGTAVAEVSFPATPCKKQARWFSDGDFRRIAHENNPQWVRWYAWVRQPGHVRPGDAVVVQG